LLIVNGKCAGAQYLRVSIAIRRFAGDDGSPKRNRGCDHSFPIAKREDFHLTVRVVGVQIALHEKDFFNPRPSQTLKALAIALPYRNFHCVRGQQEYCSNPVQ
jgi:hypothetical protein